MLIPILLSLSTFLIVFYTLYKLFSHNFQYLDKDELYFLYSILLIPSTVLSLIVYVLTYIIFITLKT